MDWNLLVTLLPYLQKYDYKVMQELAKMIDDKWWHRWKSTATQRRAVPQRRQRKIIVMTKALDEDSVLESFVRHTLTFADAIMIDVSLASCKSRKILAMLEQEGLPIVLHEKTLC